MGTVGLASNAAFQNKMFQFAQQLAAAVMRKIIFFGALAHGGALGGVHAGQCQQVVCQGSGITGRGA